MEIRGVKGQLAPGQVSPSVSIKAPAGPLGGGAVEGPDCVEISPVARYLEQYSRLPEVRSQKVAQAQQTIEDGSLDTTEKLSVAIDRLLDDLLAD